MPSLRRISVENYRAFASGLDLDLRPLTLIYGRNNAGKSSIVRLAGIVHDSLAESTKSPFDLSGAAGGKASFLDVLNGRARELKYLRLTLRWDDDFCSSSWRIGLYGTGDIDRIRVEELLVTEGAAPGEARPVAGMETLRPRRRSRRPTPSACRRFRSRGWCRSTSPPCPSCSRKSCRTRLLEIRGHRPVPLRGSCPAAFGDRRARRVTGSLRRRGGGTGDPALRRRGTERDRDVATRRGEARSAPRTGGAEDLAVAPSSEHGARAVHPLRLHGRGHDPGTPDPSRARAAPHQGAPRRQGDSRHGRADHAPP